MAENDQHVPGTCHSDHHCRNHDGRTAHPTTDPLCQACLDHAAPAIRGLVYDYVDLAQLHEPAMSQALDEKTGGGRGNESPTLLADHVEALQAEIVHVLSMWEYELRRTGNLSDPNTFAPLWRRAVYDHINLMRHDPVLVRARTGTIVQRAVAIITPRLDRLAALKLTLVCPTGVEDEPVYMFGWQAVHQLQALHQRARGALGRTRRLLSLHGTCPSETCTAEALYRYEPQDFEDEPPVWCDVCKTSRTYAEYESFMIHLKWPRHEDDNPEHACPERIAA